MTNCLAALAYIRKANMANKLKYRSECCRTYVHMHVTYVDPCIIFDVCITNGLSTVGKIRKKHIWLANKNLSHSDLINDRLVY